MALLRMNSRERREFVDWRAPQYQGPFSTVDARGIAWTWLPDIGLVSAHCAIAQRLGRVQVDCYGRPADEVGR